jgi:hypothetical protein
MSDVNLKADAFNGVIYRNGAQIVAYAAVDSAGIHTLNYLMETLPPLPMPSADIVLTTLTALETSRITRAIEQSAIAKRATETRKANAAQAKAPSAAPSADIVSPDKLTLEQRAASDAAKAPNAIADAAALAASDATIDAAKLASALSDSAPSAPSAPTMLQSAPAPATRGNRRAS